MPFDGLIANIAREFAYLWTFQFLKLQKSKMGLNSWKLVGNKQSIHNQIECYQSIKIRRDMPDQNLGSFFFLGGGDTTKKDLKISRPFIFESCVLVNAFNEPNMSYEVCQATVAPNLATNLYGSTRAGWSHNRQFPQACIIKIKDSGCIKKLTLVNGYADRDCKLFLATVLF